MIKVHNNRLNLTYTDSNFESFTPGDKTLKFYNNQNRFELPLIAPNKTEEYNFVLNGVDYEGFIVQEAEHNKDRKHWFSSEEDLKLIKEIRRVTIVAPKLELIGLDSELNLDYLVTYEGKQLYWMLWAHKLGGSLKKLFSGARQYQNPKLIALINETKNLTTSVDALSLTELVQCQVVSMKTHTLDYPLSLTIEKYGILGEITISVKSLLKHTLKVLNKQETLFCLLPMKGSFKVKSENTFEGLCYVESDDHYLINPNYGDLENRKEFKDLWENLRRLGGSSKLKEKFSSSTITIEQYLDKKNYYF